VTIFSERESYENWTEFSDNNYTLSLEGNITDVWRSMLESDVFILARSTFSIVPAIVSSRIHTAVYLPYTRNDPKPLPEWSVVPSHMLREGMKLVANMKKSCSETQVAEARNMNKGTYLAKFVWPENA
jgi:hypothetical protein